MSIKAAEWYVRNKSKIMLAIFFFAVILIISIIVGILGRINSEEQANTTYGNIEVEPGPVANFTDIYVEGGESVVTGEDITSSQVTMLGYVNQFVDLCNEQKIEEAYNLLSEECKEEVYPSLDSFRNNYYNAIFNGQKRNISVESWANNIYKVKFEMDALSTGVYTEENTVQDYIAVVKNENDEAKLNVNGYIGRNEVNKTQSSSNVTITALRSDSFMDYETYTYSVTNNTNKTILLDDKEDTANMYLEDENGNTYTAYIHELSDAELMITPGETKEITIKYYNKYGTTKNIKNIVFNKIILNYNTNEVRQTARIQIGL